MATITQTRLYASPSGNIEKHFKFTFTFTFHLFTTTEYYLLLLLSPHNLFTFLPLLAFLTLLANNLGQLLHFS